MTKTTKPRKPKPKKPKPFEPLHSVAIQRIIDEVKDEKLSGGGYNRVYHRHNR